jgi:hypothetical protein
MKEQALRRFTVKLTERPFAATVRLLSDYLTYVGMVVFWLFLVVSKRPLAWLERRLRRPIRERIISWAARLAQG